MWKAGLLLSASVTALALSSGAYAATAVNAACPSETAFFDPGNGEDIIVPPGYKVEVFAKGLNFPTNIAFRGNANNFQVFVTEAGAALPSACNTPVGFPSSDAANPFLPDVKVLDSKGNTVAVLGRSGTVAGRDDPGVLHAPTIGISFERGFQGGRLFVSDSQQREPDKALNSSRIVSVDPNNPAKPVTPLITGLPTGDHPTEQITVKPPFIYWSQGSATNDAVVGHDNGATTIDSAPFIQHDIPCQDVTLSGNNFSNGGGIMTGGYLPFGTTGTKGQVVPAFSGATQPGMCTGAILRARLDDPQHTVEPFSWGYRNPFGLRFAPDEHPLKGALLVSENGEDERGARPANNAPDRIDVTRGGLDYHGWPDKFGFLASTQAVFNPIPDPALDDPAAVVGKPVLPVLLFPPKPSVDPLAIDPADVADVGLDFAPGKFAGGGQPDDPVKKGDVLLTREGDLGFTAGNGEPEEGHDIERIHFVSRGNSGGDGDKDADDARLTGIHTERFAFNCKQANQVVDPTTGRKTCTDPGDQAFSDQLHGINRPVDGKFGPDGAFYLIDFGAVRDFGQSDPDTKFANPADAPLPQIPGTGVIWRISKE